MTNIFVSPRCLKQRFYFGYFKKCIQTFSSREKIHKTWERSKIKSVHKTDPFHLPSLNPDRKKKRKAWRRDKVVAIFPVQLKPRTK